MAAVGQEFWFVAGACPEGAEEAACADTHMSYFSRNPSFKEAFKFNVPTGIESLHFGSFDHLIRLTDELQKYDSQCEGIVHRLERQAIELDPAAELKVTSQRQQLSFMEYFRNWSWDEAKYPKSRSVSDNMKLLMQAVSQFDEETRKRTQEFNDIKTQRGNISKKDATALLPARDMVDLCTPDVVTSGSSVAGNDFVYSDYLDTVVVILPKGAEEDFLKGYESMAENVVPMSAKMFPAIGDKDGNMLWRVVCFKNSTESLKKAFRDRRWLVRDFVYDEAAYHKLKEQRENLEKQMGQQFKLILSLYQAAWSDCVVSWMHVKAARVFVESVLRFGMPPKFLSYAVTPVPSKAAVARRVLADMFPPRGGAPAAKQAGGRADDDDDEVYPYVSLSMTPFVVGR